MKPETLLIAAPTGLEILEPVGSGCSIAGSAWITNNFRAIEKQLPPILRQAIGDIEFLHLEQAKAILYAKSQPNASDQEERGVLAEFMAFIQLFHQALWLIKDNSVNVNLVYSCCSSPLPSARSNFLAAQNRTASGKDVVTQFSRNEIRRAVKLFNELIEPTLLIPGEDPPLSAKLDAYRSPRLGNHPSRPRIQRAIAFVCMARLKADPGTKAVDYCTALETLFSTDGVELTHKVSHRVANFLRASVDDRIEVYNTVKKAYALRSKVVHGDVIVKEDVAQVGILCARIDNILREIFLRFAESPDTAALFNSKKEALDSYFLRASFGDGAIPS